MEHFGGDRLEELAVRELAAGTAREAVVAKLIADEGVTLYEANFILAGAIQRAAQSRTHRDALAATRVSWLYDLCMLIPLFGVVATLIFLFA